MSVEELVNCVEHHVEKLADARVEVDKLRRLLAVVVQQNSCGSKIVERESFLLTRSIDLKIETQSNGDILLTTRHGNGS